MEEKKKSILNYDTVITDLNVKRIGEAIALKTLKTAMAYSDKDLSRLFKGFVRDMQRQSYSETLFSDGYDIAQEAILFLCNYRGKKLGDTVFTKTGKEISIEVACFRHTDRYIDKQFTRHLRFTTALNENISVSPEENLENNDDKYAVADAIIEKMKLKPKEYETLCAYMSGMTFLEITRLMNVNQSTIWRRMNNVRKKYSALYL